MKKRSCKCGDKLIPIYEITVDEKESYVERKGICIKCGEEVVYKTYKNNKRGGK